MTPTSAPGGTTASLERIAFFDPELGYGMFEERFAGGSQCRWTAAKTTDGGAHFGRLGTIDSWPCADDPDASLLAFDDHGDGFAYGPKLFVTHDGGVSWSPEAEPGTVTAVSALGYSVWMVEATCPPDASAPGRNCPLQLFESANGGRSWTRSPSPLPDATTSTGSLTLEPAQGQSWLVRASESAGYVIASPSPTQNGSPNSVPVWYTPNGGSSWTMEQIPCGLDALSAVLSSASDGNLTAVCAGQPGAGAQIKSTSTSDDGGRTWAVHSSCSGGSVSSQCTGSSPLNFGYLGGIDAVSSVTTFLVGARSSLLVTRDGGTSWEPVRPLIGGTDAGTDQVIFFDGHDGVVLGTESATGEPALWSTDDTGAHWSKVAPSLT